jgi:hypothetical protein
MFRSLLFRGGIRMALKSVFSTMKKTGLVKQLDQHLLLQNNNEGDGDRKNVTNSPSGALGCSRANFYQRQGIAREPVDARVRRIFDNGHGVHERLQKYMIKMGILYMDEVPLVNEEWEIQGHTDGIMSLTKSKIEVEILEIKSINSRQFSALKKAKEEHEAQANVYMFVAEEHRKMLKERYVTFQSFKKSEFFRRLKYRKRYLHLEDGSNYTREEKIKHKVEQHITMDNILYNVQKPITRAVILYECKDTQELKEFIVSKNEELLEEVLRKYAINNEAWETQTLPCRECKNKSEGRWCNYVNHCFE